jgi:uncharacterized membrane protein (UPF0127 family)
LVHNAEMNKKQTAIIFLLGIFASIVLAQGSAQTGLKRVDLSVGIHLIDTQLALTAQQHEIGLMYRTEMPQNEGMLFVFESLGKRCFWMKNTLIPLTAAFVANDGTIVNLADMKPQSEESHCSIKPVRYVLEMNQGWFIKKGIKPGMKLSGQPFKTTP